MIASIHERFLAPRHQNRAAPHEPPACTESRRNALIEEHLGMVPKVVAKTIGRGAPRRDMDEYISAGYLGLVQAARTFDPVVGVNFGVYAYGRIRGAVLDEMRKQCFLPVSAYRRLRRLKRAQDDLTVTLQRPPSDEELTKAMHITGRELREVRQIQLGAQYVADDDMDILHLIAGQAAGPEEIARNHENQKRLAEAIRLLPHQYRVVLHLHYLRGQKMKVIGKRLGLTESRISQICARAVELLRERMETSSSQNAKAA
jgi:RNA polymerase sigma factor for flagellar operon FliA